MPAATALPLATAPPDHCGIDFGTSNSAVALPDASEPSGTRLVTLEPGRVTMPTAVFFFEDGPSADHGKAPYVFGREAVGAYIDGYDGRLMRSMKSALGSSLVEEATDIGGGRAVPYIDVIATYLHRLKTLAEAQSGAALRRVVLGRPVFFVDDDAERDALAQNALAEAARLVGFEEVLFQYEPIAAAFDYERGVPGERLVLVADIGGGTSDFSIVRVGPRRALALDRRDDILASHGVHVAGTDFDRRIELQAVMPELGFRSRGPGVAGREGREVPSAVYFDLATWHLINTVYTPQRMAEVRNSRTFYADAKLHERLMRVLTRRLGHELTGKAEDAKIEVAEGGRTDIDLGHVEAGLRVPLEARDALDVLATDIGRIVDAARETLRRAGVDADGIDALYFTGGSTGLKPLTDAIAATFPDAETVRGDRYSSVAAGLGLHAARMFGRRG